MTLGRGPSCRRMSKGSKTQKAKEPSFCAASLFPSGGALCTQTWNGVTHSAKPRREGRIHRRLRETQAGRPGLLDAGPRRAAAATSRLRGRPGPHPWALLPCAVSIHAYFQEESRFWEGVCVGGGSVLEPALNPKNTRGWGQICALSGSGWAPLPPGCVFVCLGTQEMVIKSRSLPQDPGSVQDTSHKST